MKPVSKVISMANIKHRPLKAAWRFLTEKEIKNLPPTEKAAYEMKSLYYFTGKPCKHGHMAPKSRSARHCLICKDNKKAEYRDNKKLLIKKLVDKHKLMIVMGINMFVLLSDNKE